MPSGVVETKQQRIVGQSVWRVFCDLQHKKSFEFEFELLWIYFWICVLCSVSCIKSKTTEAVFKIFPLHVEVIARSISLRHETNAGKLNYIWRKAMVKYFHTKWGAPTKGIANEMISINIIHECGT